MNASLKDTLNPFKRPMETIQVRRLNLEFPDDIPEFWYDDNPFLTLLLTALSVSFPGGEKFFIDSVRQFQDKLQDPVLQAQIRGFIGQEANHTLEHIGLNALMSRKGYSTLAMEQFVRDRIAGFLKEMSPEECLARTVALEHFTAIMASAFLSNPQELEKMDPRLAKLWAWHAIEEAEHKAVAFDLYKATVDDEMLRLRTMLKVTWFFILLNSVRTYKLMREGGQLFNLKAWAKGANVLWGRPGIFRKILPQYLDFFRRDFHPWQHNNMADLEVMKARYLKEF